MVHPIEASFSVDVLEDSLIQSQLKTGLIEHFPLVRIPGDKPVDFHCFALANAVAACLGLSGSTKKGSETTPVGVVAVMPVVNTCDSFFFYILYDCKFSNKWIDWYSWSLTLTL